MNLLLIASDLGFSPSGDISPGGLQNFGRCVARVLASVERIHTLGVWTQSDAPAKQALIRKMIDVYAHHNITLDVRGFGGARLCLARAVAQAIWCKSFDYVMYLLVNQSVMTLLPGHPPYAVWEIGEELFQPVSRLRYRALKNAQQLLSISHNTHAVASRNNPELPNARVVHLSVEPPLFEPVADHDPVLDIQYQPAERVPAVFILARIDQRTLYKGHQELIAAWPQVLERCPQAELWIGGTGDGRAILERQVTALPEAVGRQIGFLGFLNDTELHTCFVRCRVFAMPSRGEGFGLVFVEAARYGLPSIGGTEDSVKEIVLHRKTGLLVDQNSVQIAQAVVELLSDDILAKRLGDSARQRYLNVFQFHHFRARLLDALDI